VRKFFSNFSKPISDRQVC